VKLAIATAPKMATKPGRWQQEALDWTDICAWAASPAGHKDCGSYVAGALLDGIRDNDHVLSRSALTLDADYPDADLPAKVAELPHAALIHTTFSSTADKPRYRILVPLDRPVLPEHYRVAADALVTRLGSHQFDTTTTEPARLMLKPATSDPSAYFYAVTPGPPASVTELMADASLADAPLPRNWKRDPTELGGSAGAFNRVYTIEEAIDHFALPYTPYTADRWTYAPASNVGGLHRIDDNELVFSHHATDPAHGRACSAFDLVRLHLFGDRDAEVTPATPITRHPSHAAMVELADADERVRAELFKDFAPASEQVEDIRHQLELKNGKVVDSAANLQALGELDPALKVLTWDGMTRTVVANPRLPWREGDPVFTDGDMARLMFHLETAYGLKLSKDRAYALVRSLAEDRVFFAPRDYLLGLRWDGRSRMRTCFPGVTPTDYTEMVARKCLVGAVARMIDPGCQMDLSLVLAGPEGIGKTRWMRAMSKGWFAQLGSLHPNQMTETRRQLYSGWIVISDEGHSMRLAEVNALKSFLTETHDTFRAPYDRFAQQRARHSVIWSTTNDQQFLRRAEGNRRFLVVSCDSEADPEVFTEAFVDQLWAEAVFLYTVEGEQPYLDPEQATTAAEHRDPFEEEDIELGQLVDYLDMPVPAEWGELTVEAKHEWYRYGRHHLDPLEPAPTGRQEAVCTSEVLDGLYGPSRNRMNRKVDQLQIGELIRRAGWTSTRRREDRRWVRGYGWQNVYTRGITP
jgi:putative DNA primase/helicase